MGSNGSKESLDQPIFLGQRKGGFWFKESVDQPVPFQMTGSTFMSEERRGGSRKEERVGGEGVLGPACTFLDARQSRTASVRERRARAIQLHNNNRQATDSVG